MLFFIVLYALDLFARYMLKTELWQKQVAAITNPNKSNVAATFRDTPRLPIALLPLFFFATSCLLGDTHLSALMSSSPPAPPAVPAQRTSEVFNSSDADVVLGSSECVQFTCIVDSSTCNLQILLSYSNVLFKVHKSHLAIGSRVFQVMFEDSVVTDGKGVVIELTESRATLSKLLPFFYPGSPRMAVLLPAARLWSLLRAIDK